MAKYELTHRIYGGPEVLQPGHVLELTDEQAESPFMRNRARPVESLEPATPAKQDAPTATKKK